MLWFLLILFFLLVLLLWLPLELDVDTEQERYAVRWAGILQFRLVPDSAGLHWMLRLFFWETELRGGEKPAQPKPEKKPVSKAKKRARKTRISFQQLRRLLRNSLRAFRVERLRINWDTGDFVRNAWLYPAFHLASHGRRQLNINFMGKQELAIRLYTRPGLLAWAALRAFIHI